MLRKISIALLFLVCAGGCTIDARGTATRSHHGAAAADGALSLTRAPLPTLPGPARSSFAAIEVGGRIFAMGGHVGSAHAYPEGSFLDRVDVFDIATGAWVEDGASSLPSPRMGFALAAGDSAIYAFGGFAFAADKDPQRKSLDVIDRYVPETDTWKTVGHLATPRSSHVVAQVGGTAYVLGGWDSTPRSAGDSAGRFLDTIEAFDLGKETVRTLDVKLPAPLRRALTAVTWGDTIVLFGGLGSGGGLDLLRDVTAFDPAAGTFTDLPELPVDSGAFSASAAVIDDRLVFFGGLAPGSGSTFTEGYFTLTRGGKDWQRVDVPAGATESKAFAQSIPLEDGALALLGGYDAKGPTGTFERFRMAE
jgi:N-acetylneuraminic acid mutarotase